MKLLFNLCLWISLSSSLFAFDVRVLLERFSILHGNTSEIKISSPHGMIVSGIESILTGSLSIVCTDEKTYINDLVISDEWIQISPALSAHHEKKIDQFIAQWIKEHESFCNEQMQGLSTFYEKF